MYAPTFIYNVFPSEKREKLINKRNVKVIKEFLRKREKLKIAKENQLAHLKQLRKDKSISASEHRRLKQALMYTHEQKRIDLIKASIGKSVKICRSVVSYDDQASENNQPLESNTENNWKLLTTKANAIETERSCRAVRKNPLSKKSTSLVNSSLIVPTARHSYAIEENFISDLDLLKRQERKLLVEKKQLLDVLDQLQSKFDIIADKKSRLLESIEKSLLSRQKDGERESDHVLFTVVSCGPSWMDGLVFTVIAENEIWAEELVRQWLISNGRENHKIDKVMALVSRDVRAIVNVGAKLLDV